MKTFEQYISERLKSMVTFNKKVYDILVVEMGKENVKEDYSTSSIMKTYIIKTKYGDLRISLHNNKSEIYSIYMRFDDPGKVVDSGIRSEMNTFSGKWNIHMSDEITALDSFEERLKKIGGGILENYSKTLPDPETIFHKEDPHQWEWNPRRRETYCKYCKTTRELKRKVNGRKFYVYLDSLGKISPIRPECDRGVDKYSPLKTSMVVKSKTEYPEDLKNLMIFRKNLSKDYHDLHAIRYDEHGKYMAHPDRDIILKQLDQEKEHFYKIKNKLMAKYNDSEYSMLISNLNIITH